MKYQIYAFIFVVLASAITQIWIANKHKEDLENKIYRLEILLTVPTVASSIEDSKPVEKIEVVKEKKKKESITRRQWRRADD